MPERRPERSHQEGSAQECEDPLDPPGRVQLLLLAQVQKHHHEDKEHHDGAGVDDDLDGEEELGLQEKEEQRDTDQVHDQKHDAHHGVAVEHHHQCRKDGDEGDPVDDEHLGTHSHPLRMAQEVQKMLSTASGMRAFHPRSMSWSNRKRGSVQRTQT